MKKSLLVLAVFLFSAVPVGAQEKSMSAKIEAIAFRANPIHRNYSPILPVGITCSISCEKNSCSRICTDTQTCTTTCDAAGFSVCECN